MAVRVLLVLAAFAVLCGCAQASSPAEKQEKQGGVEEVAPSEQQSPAPQEETTQQGPPGIQEVGVGMPVGYNRSIVVWEIASAEVTPGPRYNDLLNRQEQGPFLVMEAVFTNNSQEYLEVNDCLLNLYTDMERIWLCTLGSDTVPEAKRFDSEGLAPGATLEGTLAVKLREGETPLYLEILDQHPMQGGTPFARVQLAPEG
jgi:hypothetical protein